MNPVLIRPVKVSEIRNAVARHYKMNDAVFDKPARQQSVVEPRHIAIYLSRDMLGYSLPRLGRLFGDRDHSTIRHAFEKISEQLKWDEALWMKVSEIRAEIKTGSIVRSYNRQIADEYAAGKSSVELAKRYKCSAYTILRIVRVSGVPVRSRGVAGRPQKKKRNSEVLQALKLIRPG